MSSKCYIPKQSVRLNGQTVESIPGDKSVSHRAAMIGSIAENESHFDNFLCSEDCLNTVKILQALGADIQLEAKQLSVKGLGLQGLSPSKTVLDVGNSGTGIRLLTGLLSAQSFASTITGDHSIQSRPMKRVIDPLQKMGACISGVSKGTDILPPLTIEGKATLNGIHYDMPIASAQVKSAILFAGLYAQTPLTIQEPVPSRDHTERLLTFYGADFSKQGRLLKLGPSKSLRNPMPERRLWIPSDISSAMFYIVLTLCVQNAAMTLPGIGLNETRSAVIPFLESMGARIRIEDQVGDAFEPYATVSIESGQLKNRAPDSAKIPNLIDEFPILAVLSLFAEGEWVVRGAKELRVKESDRIAGIVRLVRSMGCDIEEMEDGFKISGKQTIQPFEFDSFGDHRLAMSAIIAALAGGVAATVENIECISTSFPNFFDILETLGVQIQRKNT